MLLLSKESENVLKRLKETMYGKTGDENEDINTLIKNFMSTLSIQDDLSEQNAETSDDFLELANSAPTKKKALQYAKKALELDPDNLDAEIMIADLSATTPEKLVDKYKKLIDKATKKLKKQGFFSEDCIGDFWLITETRPYMRLRLNYLDTLIEATRIHLAIDECNEMLRLCKNDNMGVRYILMHLYVYLEDEQSALKLLEKYPEESTQFLLPLSILYYKLGNLTESTKYLEKLNEVNKDTYKFFGLLLSNNFDECLGEINPYGYKPFTIEEFIEEMKTNIFLLSQMVVYFDWAFRKLKTIKKQTKNNLTSE